jgi:hypothetical protein
VGDLTNKQRLNRLERLWKKHKSNNAIDSYLCNDVNWLITKEKELNDTIIPLTVFIKSGGQESINCPAPFVVDLIKSIREKGFETMHLSGGRSIEVTGVLMGGRVFHQEERVIFVGVKDK